MARRFRLSEFKDVFQIGNTHFTVGHDQIQNPQTGSVGAGKKYLRTRVNIEMFKSQKSLKYDLER